jgi:hypothetical protein
MGKFKESNRLAINEAAGHYLTEQEEGDNYDAYVKLLEESDKGNDDCLASDYVEVWEKLEGTATVAYMIKLIEDSIVNPKKDIPEVILGIDWSDLRAQKTMLLETINNDAVDPEHKEGLEGILNLIDSLQDYAVDVLGIPEMHVFDFEEEEKRENETFNEKFARESAESIFDFLCESDGFHQEDDMSVEYIAGIMSIRYHSDIIKANIKNQILTDLKENSREFVYDDTQRPQYDADMREDYEGIATSYIREVFKKFKPKK